MEIQDFETQSLLYAKLAQKQAELAAYDGRQRIASEIGRASCRERV